MTQATKHTPPYQLERYEKTSAGDFRGAIMGPMGECYATLDYCTGAFANRVIERLNAHDELVAALHLAADLLDANPTPVGIQTLSAHIRAALAKVQA